MATVTRFRDDDDGYLGWLNNHPDGFVINIHRSDYTASARVHRASCRTIRGQNPARGGWTKEYVKVCAEHLPELEQWAIAHVGERIAPCGRCQPDGVVAQATSIDQAELVKRKLISPLPDGGSEICGPSPDWPVLEAWADDYIRPAWQERLRTRIRDGCGQLKPSADQVLHATYFGAKPPNADVENLALYNIDSFRVAGRNGIRFEYGAVIPPAPSGTEYPSAYRYVLAPRSGAFDTWRQGRAVASFDWTDLGAFAGDKKLAQVWLALARGRHDHHVADPACTPETPFAVRVEVRPPDGCEPVWGGLVKGIFDGVICAFQAHTDATILTDVAARIARILPAEPEEIEMHLRDESRAVLGAAQRLVKPFGAGVQWAPADHMCVAGELLGAQPAGSRWAIRGELIEVFR